MCRWVRTIFGKSRRGAAAPANPAPTNPPAPPPDTLKLSYFDETLAVEHYAINLRRRKLAHTAERPHHPIERLVPSDAGTLTHPQPPLSHLPMPTLTPAATVDLEDPKKNFRTRPRPIPSTAVGVALSGGGIRSAAFCLGALQALDSHNVIERTDYLSTVSGGGYIGSCMTAGMSQNSGDPPAKGKFPFGGESDIRDNDAVGHLRNFSNYLMPRVRSGMINLLDVTAIILRGLLVNSVLVFMILIFAAIVTYASYPNWDDLETGNFAFRFLFVGAPRVVGSIPWLLIKGVSALMPAGIEHWLTTLATPAAVPISYLVSGYDALLYSLTIPFIYTGFFASLVAGGLIAWAITRSDVGHTGNDANSRDLVKIRWMLGITFVSAFLDLQPLCIHELDSLSKMILGLASLPALAAAATVVLFARRLGAFLETTRLSKGLLTRVLRIATHISLVAAGLVLPLILLVAYWHLTAWLYAEGGVQPSLRLQVLPYAYGVALLISAFVASLIRANAYSLHQFYKDRLSRAFLFKEVPGGPEQKGLRSFKLSWIDTTASPYHIVNAALNVQGSPEANRRGRNADFFTFSRDFVGSDLTHFAQTSTKAVGALDMERIDPRLDFGSAMAISGAAISANMGSNTVRWLSPTLALFNIRLGYWLRNPRHIAANPQTAARHKNALHRYWDHFLGNFYLLLEMFNRLDEKRDYIFLSDGGHIENLGIYQLLKRGCRLIIAIDAEADPEISCASLLKLERYARIDLGIRIILPWEQIRNCNRRLNEDIDPRTPQEAARRLGPHCALGPILYEDGSRGTLLYFKSSLSGDEKDYVLDYKKRNKDFPHETTGDQFFTEEQFEVYRSLGYHVVEGYFSGSDEVSWLRTGRRAWPSIGAARAEVRQALGWT